MINLLVKERKISITRMYYVRLATLLAFMMMIVVLLALAFLSPSYNATIDKEARVLSELSALKQKAVDPKDELSNIVADINKKLAIFANPSERFIYTKDGVTPILNRKNSDTLITSMVYDGTGTTKKITVNGMAKNREALLSFESELKKETDFQGVNVPISNFVEGSNISFSIQFTVK